MIISGLMLSAAALADSTPARPPAFRLIVHPQNPVHRLDRKFLADAFLKKRTRWRGDHVIAPVDLHAHSSTRRAFSRAILNRPITAVRRYWQRIVFSGRGVPPPELNTDAAVIAYVSRHREAIGYVSGRTGLTGVKVVTVH